VLTNLNNNETGIPTEFKLSQNYPNPFNPSTSIKYALPKNSSVKLIVYGLLGNEIKTLVNEKQTAGTYETKFDATTLASGVYYYKLITEGFVETKQMVLIK
jgi:hypothetical protein